MGIGLATGENRASEVAEGDHEPLKPLSKVLAV